MMYVARKNALIGYDGIEGWARPAWDNDRPFRIDVNVD